VGHLQGSLTLKDNAEKSQLDSDLGVTLEIVCCCSQYLDWTFLVLVPQSKKENDTFRCNLAILSFVCRSHAHLRMKLNLIFAFLHKNLESGFPC
jgi:hypothetical protein